MTTIYHYDGATGVLTGSSEARVDPLEPTRVLVPARATTVAPPPVPEGKVARFNGGAWRLVDATVEETPEIMLAAWRAERLLTRLEFAVAMRTAGILTQAEALEFVTYSIPAPLAAMIAGLDAEHQDDATLLMAGAQEFPRDHAMWGLFAASEGGMTAAQIDAVFGWTG